MDADMRANGQLYNHDYAGCQETPHESSRPMLQCWIISRQLVMTSDFWVGSIPFDLLCGWPWQWKNKVNIEEQNNGTWLVHKSSSRDKLWELCAVPAHCYKDWVNSHFFCHVPKSPVVFPWRDNKHNNVRVEEVTDKDTWHSNQIQSGTM